MEKSTIQSRLPPSLKYLGVGGYAADKHPIKCVVCGHQWSAKLSNVLHGSGCPSCWSKKRADKPNCSKTDAQYKQQVKTLYGDKYKPVEKYATALTPILHRCSAGHTEKRKPNYVLSGAATPCLTCSYTGRTDSLKIPEREYKKRLKARGGFILVANYTAIRSKATHKCLTCNHVWDVMPYSLIAGQGCPVCAKNNANYCRYRVKEYKLGKRTVKVQGYEPQALDWLVKVKKIPPNSIAMDVPRITYVLDGRTRLHIPDFWMPASNIVCEVKSLRTIGLWYEPLFDQIKAKRMAAISLGYDYRVLLFDSCKKLRLPKNWWQLTHATFKEKLKNANSSASKRVFR